MVMLKEVLMSQNRPPNTPPRSGLSDIKIGSCRDLPEMPHILKLKHHTFEV